MSRTKEILRSGRWFSSLPDAFQDRLVAHGVIRKLKDGEALFRRGDPPSGLFAVVEGAVRITATTESGKEALLTLVEPPGWFGEIAVFDGEPRTHDGIADGDTEVLHVPADALSRILDAEPRSWRHLGLLLTQKLRLLLLAMEDTATSPLATRLAHRLAWMAAGYGEFEGRTARDLAVSQEELASMMAASRQSVNQALKELEARGWIKITYGHIEVLDVEALRTAE